MKNESPLGKMDFIADEIEYLDTKTEIESNQSTNPEVAALIGG